MPTGIVGIVPFPFLWRAQVKRCFLRCQLSKQTELWGTRWSFYSQIPTCTTKKILWICAAHSIASHIHPSDSRNTPTNGLNYNSDKLSEQDWEAVKYMQFKRSKKNRATWVSLEKFMLISQAAAKSREGHIPLLLPLSSKYHRRIFKWAACRFPHSLIIISSFLKVMTQQEGLSNHFVWHCPLWSK